jgi:hypothetical protein
VSGLVEIGGDPRPERSDQRRERVENEVDAEEKRRRAIEETFCEWHKDPVRIARLYRWLELRERPPIDVASFIECAATYQQDYDDLQMWSGKA